RLPFSRSCHPYHCSFDHPSLREDIERKHKHMKNLFRTALLIALVALAQPSPAKDITSRLPRHEKIDAAEAQKLINRLEEIKAMDKSKLTRAERRALKKEVRAARKRLESSGGVYLSVGVLIVIILLLILFA